MYKLLTFYIKKLENQYTKKARIKEHNIFLN